jgi:4-aminobutyrate aminotransferase-like enzyme
MNSSGYIGILARESVNWWMYGRMAANYFVRRNYFAKAEPSDISVGGRSAFQLLHNEHDAHQVCEQAYTYQNMEKSKGSFLVDCDGNAFLDLNGTEANPIGYNHGSMLKSMVSREWDAF